MTATVKKTDDQQTSEFFDHYAENFNAIYSSGKGWLATQLNRFFRRSMRLRFELSVAHCSPIEGKTVLDIGCGPGHYCIALAQKGAANVLGIDFAEQMLELARDKARQANVQNICSFENKDFFELGVDAAFDYVLLMGFMDYVSDAGAVIEKALALAGRACFFSFPASGGILAWQRKIRYKKRCPLYLYSYEQIEELFQKHPGFHFKIRKIDRDFWVQVTRKEL